MATWEDKCYHSKCPPFLLLLPALLPSMILYDQGCLFGHLWSAVPAVPPPNFLLTPSLLTDGQCEKPGIDIVQALFSNN